MNAQAMIADLMRAGMTQMEIERESGVDQSTVSGIYTGRRGKRISYEVMSKLKGLHDRMICGGVVAPEAA